MSTVREHLDALGFTSGNHDVDVREALLELRHARLSLAEFRKEKQRPIASAEPRRDGELWSRQ